MELHFFICLILQKQQGNSLSCSLVSSLEKKIMQYPQLSTDSFQTLNFIHVALGFKYEYFKL